MRPSDRHLNSGDCQTSLEPGLQMQNCRIMIRRAFRRSRMATHINDAFLPSPILSSRSKRRQILFLTYCRDTVFNLRLKLGHANHPRHHDRQTFGYFQGNFGCRNNIPSGNPSRMRAIPNNRSLPPVASVTSGIVYKVRFGHLIALTLRKQSILNLRTDFSRHRRGLVDRAIPSPIHSCLPKLSSM